MNHSKLGQKSDKSSNDQQKQHKTSPTTAPQVNGTHPATLIQRAKLNPNSLSSDDVLRLQQTIGNRAVTKLLAGRSGQQVQAKLTIGEPGDKYEQEADRVAAQVVKQINAPVSQQAGQSQPIQREEVPEQEKQLQMKPMLQLRSAKVGMTAAPEVEASIQQARGGGQPLADSIREPMEEAFGADFSAVKVHTDAMSSQLNQSIQARAFTTGQDVFFRQGEYNPGSRGGQELIAHELTHVVQQNPRAVQRSPKLQVRGHKGATDNADTTLDWSGRAQGFDIRTMNRGAAHAIHRKKADAENFVQSFDIEMSQVTKKTVSAFVQNEENDKAARRGLLEAWNKGQTVSVNIIPTPSDLQSQGVGSTGTGVDFRGYDSDEETGLDIEKMISVADKVELENASGVSRFKAAVLPLASATRVCRQIAKKEAYKQYFSEKKGLVAKAGEHYLELAAPRYNDIVVVNLKSGSRPGTYKRDGVPKEWREIGDMLDQTAPEKDQKDAVLSRLVRFFQGEDAVASKEEALAVGAIAADLMKGSGGMKWIKVLEFTHDYTRLKDLFAGQQPLYEPAVSGGRSIVREETARVKKELAETVELFSQMAMSGDREGE